MTRRDLLRGAAMTTLGGLALAWGGGASAAARTHRIGMRQMRFGAVPAGIKAGDTIVWVNADVVPHTATARNGSFDIVLAARQSRSMVVRRAGRFDFYCKYHPAMRGTLTVAAA